VPPPPCTFALSADPGAFSAGGGDGVVDVKTGDSCKWTATASHDWIGLSSTPTAGSGRVGFYVRPNAGEARRAQIQIGTASVTITQEGVLKESTACVTSVSPEREAFKSYGGRGLVTVTARDGCAWRVDAPAWIAVRLYEGKGSMEFVFEVQSNAGGPRSGLIIVGDKRVEIRQDGGIGT
jgi:hypothetical protein